MTSEDRLWAQVDASGGPDACWPGNGHTDTGGYGQLRVCGRQVKAHRYAYLLRVGPIPNGQSVLHACDHKLCCNPSHLRTGTHTDNMQDRTSRGRHPIAVLCPEAVRRARWLHDYGQGSCYEIGRALGYSRETVRDAVARRTYGWVVP